MLVCGFVLLLLLLSVVKTIIIQTLKQPFIPQPEEATLAQYGLGSMSPRHMVENAKTTENHTNYRESRGWPLI